ncbi:hypothetical protein M2352_002566 [Azospirillum fermentarium]|uniref:hypothetical protein n=1 Tax=Azospirillum fermentarium TaxID=1233114 RepID=UPI0022261DEB|nr:hypothetical protein [Azospirillum fermentarium]MCW2246975.1 hypothetical protein [Azospirillum fermentarium]
MLKPMLTGAAVAATLFAAPLMAQDGVTMTDPVSTNWADNWSVNGTATPPMDATGAYPQGTYGSTGTMDQGAMGSGSAGSSGTSMGGTGAMTAGRVMIDVGNDTSIRERRGRGQNMTELTQTSLLNSFSSAGFMGVRNFHKDGDRYMAEAQQRDGSWTTVEMDAKTGTIRSAR